MEETERLAAAVVETEYPDFRPEIIDAARTAIRDFIGVALYGSRHPIGERMGAYVRKSLSGPAATILGDGRASAEGAALANGVAGHAIDYDDTFASIPIHPTGPSFSAALAVAEASTATTQELLTGYLVGVETTYRVGRATFPAHYYTGFHSTGTAGSFGATAAACSVLGLDVTQTRRAFGICASGSSALLKNFGTMTKPYHAGHAAGMGVRAARLAKTGFTADESILSGDTGYGAVMGFGDYDPSAITDGLGGTWAVSEVGLKRYPVILIVQAPMEALRRVVQREDLTIEDIAGVTATLPDKAADVLRDEPPENADQAKFTIEFPLASILQDGDLTLAQLSDEYVQDPRIRRAMRKVERVFDSAALGDGFDRYGGRVTVQTTGNSVFTEAEPITPGMPGNPLSDDQLRAKFNDCTHDVISPSRREELWEALSQIDAISLPSLTEALGH